MFGLAVRWLAVELLRNLGGEEETAAAEGSGKAVGNEVGLEDVEPGERLSADASLLGNVPRILIFDVFPGREAKQRS